VAALLLLYGRKLRAEGSGRVSRLPLEGLPRTLRQRFFFVPVLLQCLALTLVAVALSRPVRGNVLRSSIAEGVDIALLVDRSSSMAVDDLERGKNRLEVVKEVVGDFAERRMTDRVGASDNVALFVFARYPELLCPFTLDVAALKGFLTNVQLVRYEQEDGTGIGRALAKAVAVLRQSEAKSKVAVLLTDGENNIDDLLPAEAADLAAEEGIRVYTVLAGRYSYSRDLFGRIVATEAELDGTELEQIAEKTGGRFFRAKDKAALEGVYAEIESLERTPREEQRYTRTFDLYALFLLPALCLYFCAWLSSSTWARRLP
jgi:Ca-activated chloride channel family protein